MNRDRIGWCVTLAGVAALLLSCGQAWSPQVHKSTRFLMGTFVEVAVVGSRNNAKIISNAVFEEIKRVEDLTSFHASSALSIVNDSSGQGRTKADPELLTLIEDSLRFARQTDGAFDPTLGPLTGLWSFSAGEPQLPTKEAITEALAKTGWQKVKIDAVSGTVFLPEKGMSLDLGGIAKGYALDKAREVLTGLKASGVLVNAGGDILAFGEKGPDKPWRIGVQDPRNPRGIVAVASIKDKVIVTSGDYERFFIRDGKRYHHILDPKTGYPTQGLQSVTIVAYDGETADALATAVFALGLRDGLKLVESVGGVECFLIDADGHRHLSTGVSSFLQVIK